MAKHIFSASFSVRIGTKRVRFQLEDAQHYGKNPGLYRVCVDRRWIGGDAVQVFDRTTISRLLLDAALGTLPQELSACPDLRPQMRVSVHELRDGVDVWHCAWVVSPPVMACDGEWKVAVTQYGNGVEFVSCKHVIRK